jgi:hypothetical protein
MIVYNTRNFTGFFGFVRRSIGSFPPLTCGWKQIQFPKRCVLHFFGIPDDGQGPNPQ